MLFCLLEIDVYNSPVVARREVFGEIIGKVLCTLIPLEADFFLFDAAVHPDYSCRKLWSICITFFR